MTELNTNPNREEILHALDGGGSPVIHRALIVEENAFNDAERTITAYCTTLDRDRFGDTIQPAGMRNANYRNNPVVLWAHNYDMPPIAKSLWERPDEKGVRICMQFDTRDEAMEIYRLYREGYLNAFSIGFLPIAFERIFENNVLTGLNFTDWELIECSAVPVPANPNALQDALARGLVRSEVILSAMRPDGAHSNDDDGYHSEQAERGELEFHAHIAQATSLIDCCREAAGHIRRLGELLREFPDLRISGGLNRKNEPGTIDATALIERIAERELRRRRGAIN